MGRIGGGHASDPLCPKDRACLEWARRYLKDCVCSVRDEVSFALGLASVLCWGVAEVPQIITNFRECSTEGVSLLFLMTWVVGDVFNLVGCYLEPSTLPTQFFMALLYTITTLILVGQVIYYQHIMKWPKGGMVSPTEQRQDEPKEVIKPAQRMDTALPTKPPAPHASSPIVYAQRSPSAIQGRDLYYTSARSLASSHTPTAGSLYLSGSRGSGGGRGSICPLLQHNSLEDSHDSHLPISINTSRSAPAPINAGSPILRAVASLAMCVGGLNISRGLTLTQHGETSPRASNPRVFLGRKLFQAKLQTSIFNATLYQSNEMEESLGVWFGWMMAAIYMGGRLPQIWLNIKRGSVEGLNPLMFTFALLGNATYVGSILVRSTEWMKIKSNMPWLVDAGVCVVLDCFILFQFIYYYTRKPKDGKEDLGGDYKYLE